MASESQLGLQEVLGPEETQLWESVVIVRRLSKYYSELWV
jgi:hypothetical protein